MNLSCEISSRIKLDPVQLPSDLRAMIVAELTLPNPERIKAIEQMVYGAEDLPREISIFHEHGGEMLLPRGFAHRLEEMATGLGHRVDWRARMTLDPLCKHRFRHWAPAELRDYQREALDALLHWCGGVIQMPTGSGKTRVGLELIRFAGQRSIVVVDKTSIARQWAARAAEAYGYEVGIIGEGEWEVRDLTIALRQSLWSRREDLDEDFYAQFGVLIIDEMQHLHGSLSLVELVQSFPAFYRIGLSATPVWDPMLFPLVRAVIGPIVYKTTPEQVAQLVRPSIVVEQTDFDFPRYRPTRFIGGRRVSNNYSEMMSALVDDRERNALIASVVLREVDAGHHVLVVTRRIEHVKALVAMLEGSLVLGRQLHVLTGDQTGADARRVAHAIEKSLHGTVLISTVADEALDIPRLDRLVLAFPVRKGPLIQQQIGRISREAERKTDAVVYDLKDRQGVLVNQFRERMQTYQRMRWAVRMQEEATA